MPDRAARWQPTLWIFVTIETHFTLIYSSGFLLPLLASLCQGARSDLTPPEI